MKRTETWVERYGSWIFLGAMMPVWFCTPGVIPSLLLSSLILTILIVYYLPGLLGWVLLHLATAGHARSC